MIRRANETTHTDSLWVGLRMNADEFLQIIDESHNYELIDGVVSMTPSPTPKHQQILSEIHGQLYMFLRSNPIGLAFPETDVHIGEGPTGGDLVYRPELLFYRSERLLGMENKLFGPPDLVVEVISQGSRFIDEKTKKDDYERFGVREYWLIDPENEAMTFFRLRGDRFVEVPFDGDQFTSEAVPGFVLDVARVRDCFAAW